MAIIWLIVGVAVGYFGKDKISALATWAKTKVVG
jgi:hypothetical protein